MKRSIALIVMVCVLAVSLFSAGVKEVSEEDLSLKKIQEKGKFVLGLDDSFPPLGFRNEKNEIVGFDIDVAREVCNRLGVELVLQVIDWNAK
ncbi:MAG: transporter substrate-binding domain-containing protein, partial [Sphaerochaetaceae bacterium]